MERCSRDAMDPNLRHKPRLISEEELPSWLLKGEEEVCAIKFFLSLTLTCAHPVSACMPLKTLCCSPQMDQLEYEANEGRLFGRGSRARKTVDYSEMLTEREWLRVCLSVHHCTHNHCTACVLCHCVEYLVSASCLFLKPLLYNIQYS